MADCRRTYCTDIEPHRHVAWVSSSGWISSGGFRCSWRDSKEIAVRVPHPWFTHIRICGSCNVSKDIEQEGPQIPPARYVWESRISHGAVQCCTSNIPITKIHWVQQPSVKIHPLTCRSEFNNDWIDFLGRKMRLMSVVKTFHYFGWQIDLADWILSVRVCTGLSQYLAFHTCICSEQELHLASRGWCWVARDHRSLLGVQDGRSGSVKACTVSPTADTHSVYLLCFWQDLSMKGGSNQLRLIKGRTFALIKHSLCYLPLGRFLSEHPMACPSLRPHDLVSYCRHVS